MNEENDTPLILQFILLAFCVLAMIALTFTGYSVADGLTRQFTGTQEFATIQEAQQFQNQVLQAALDYNAKVPQADITILSPPTVTFRVLLPIRDGYPKLFSGDLAIGIPQEPYQFPYGEVSGGKLGFWLGGSIIALMGLSGAVLFIVLGWYALRQTNK